MALLAIYLLTLLLAEMLVTYTSPLLVFAIHGGLIAATAGVLFFTHHEADRRGLSGAATAVAIALILGPLVRIISLTLPLAQLDPGWRFVFAGIPMTVACVIAARASGYRLSEVGIRWRATTWQLAVILVSIPLGVIEYVILRPDALGGFPWSASALGPAISVGVFTGFPEELLFRGVMQTALRPFVGRWNWVYVAAVFAALHIGYQNYIDFLFVFAVGLMYGWIFERTRSILGISIGHGVANITLFFVAPNLIDPTSLPTIGPELQFAAATVSVICVSVASYLISRELRIRRARRRSHARRPPITQDRSAPRRPDRTR